MSILYHSDKANVVVDALSRLSMGSTTHVEEEKRKLYKDVQRFTCLGVRLIDSTDEGIDVINGAELSLMSEVKVNKSKIPFCLS